MVIAALPLCLALAGCSFEALLPATATATPTVTPTFTPSDTATPTLSPTATAPADRDAHAHADRDRHRDRHAKRDADRLWRNQRARTRQRSQRTGNAICRYRLAGARERRAGHRQG